MKTLINTNGKQITVTDQVYDEAYRDFIGGCWVDYVCDANGISHIINLEENFRTYEKN